jgi:hypothetical protein
MMWFGNGGPKGVTALNRFQVCLCHDFHERGPKDSRRAWGSGEGREGGREAEREGGRAGIESRVP